MQTLRPNMLIKGNSLFGFEAFLLICKKQPDTCLFCEKAAYFGNYALKIVYSAKTREAPFQLFQSKKIPLIWTSSDGDLLTKSQVKI